MRLIWKRLAIFYSVSISLAVLLFTLVIPHSAISRPQQVLGSNAQAAATQVSDAAKTETPVATVASPKPVAAKAPVPSPYDQAIVALKSLGDHYGITVGVNAPATHTLGTAEWEQVTTADQAQLAIFTKYLTDEWGKYPVDFVHRTGLTHLYIVKSLKVSGQARAAMPEPVFEDAVYYDISPIYINNSTYMRNVIHHEYDHLIEYNIHGSYSWDDAAWKACNTADFTYGIGGWAAYADPAYANTPHPRSGFVTGYGTYGIEEDKAEIYAEFLMGKSNLDTLVGKDSNLACKTSLYRQYMSSLGLSL